MPLHYQTKTDPSTLLGVWHITESAEWLRDRLVLSEAEEDHYRTIRNELRKQQWLSYRLLIDTLLEAPRPGIVYNEYGKPVFLDNTLSLSVSHSGPFSAVIISRTRMVGIDIEGLRDRIFRVSDRFLSEEESTGIGDTFRLEKTVIHWGIKEALYKLQGKPEVEFKTDIHVAPFEYLCSGSGNCSARMRTPASEDEYEIGFKTLGEYILVYAMSKGS